MLGTNLFGMVANKPKKNSNGDALIQTQSFNGQSASLESFLGAEQSLKEKDVLAIPAFQAALELTTSSVAQLPIKLYKRADQNEFDEIRDDYRLKILNKETNSVMNGFNFKKKMARDVLLYGSSKSYLEYESKTSNIIDSIYPLDMKDMRIDVYTTNGFKKYGIDVLANQSGTQTFYDDMLLSVLRDSDDGIIGRGILEENESTLRLAISQNSYESNLMRNGAMPTSVLETESKLNDTQINRMRQSWSSLYEGAKNAGKTVILESGLKYKPASLNPDTLQLTDGKKSIISDIARMFNLPESMINSYANKYDSTEQNNLWFLQYTLSPIIVSIETALNTTLLLEEEKELGYEFRFDPSSLLRITTSEQVETTIKKFNAGIITNYEAKRSLGSTVTNNEEEFYKLTTGVVMYKTSNRTIINPNTGITLTDDGVVVTDVLNKSTNDKPTTPSKIGSDKSEETSE